MIGYADRFHGVTYVETYCWIVKNKFVFSKCC